MPSIAPLAVLIYLIVHLKMRISFGYSFVVLNDKFVELKFLQHRQIIRPNLFVVKLSKYPQFLSVFWSLCYPLQM